ncbi:MAG: CPBP family intramembrane metalloprotease [Nitrosopumilus sp. H13]|nr:MAG: CPBP family intramembrane metalloprotease [Nitrosopumilus sp. H13]
MPAEEQQRRGTSFCRGITGTRSRTRLSAWAFQKRASSFTSKLQSRLLQALGIPFTALLSVVFGLFLVSFPIGMFVVFESELGGDINHEYPLTHLDLFYGTDLYQSPSWVTMGDVFVALWALYAVVFVVSMMGPRQGFLRSLSAVISHGKYDSLSSYMVGITKWFSVLVLASVVVDIVQSGFGVKIVPPASGNDLEQFFYVSLAPVLEEVGFRVVLLGIPLFVMYSGRTSIRYFVRCLWRPYDLDIIHYRKAAVLIAVVAVLFGLAHIVTGEPWSEGKFAPAAASGAILGWAYLRYGFAASLLIHWATNYFIFAYATFVSQTNLVSLEVAFMHPLLSSIEIILIVAGVVSVLMMMAHRLRIGSEV